MRVYGVIIIAGSCWLSACSNSSAFSGQTKVTVRSQKPAQELPKEPAQELPKDSDTLPPEPPSPPAPEEPEYISPCQPSRRVALITNTVVQPRLPAGSPITFERIPYADALGDASRLDAFDTLAVEMLNEQDLNKPRGGLEYKVPDFALRRLQAGAKVILLWNKTLLSNFSMMQLEIQTAHFHNNSLANTPEITFNKKGSSLIVDAFEPAQVGARQLLQIYPKESRADKISAWAGDSSAIGSDNLGPMCGTLSYDNYERGSNKGPFHGYLPDTAGRKGVLFLLGVDYFDESGFDLTDRFLAAHFEQTWDGSEELSTSCNLTCDETEWAMDQGMGKPVIYLYPTKPQKIKVELEVKGGRLVTTYPEYDPKLKGWEVLAQPDGTLTNLADKQEYSYIYWTATSRALKVDFSEGFVVKGEETRAFLQQKLKAIGMTPREYNEMIVYWLPYMERHKYNVIKFLAEEYTSVAPMTITPKPDSLLRVFMVFRESDKPIEIKLQTLPKPFVRSGFSVVEWGGSEFDGEWTVFK